MFNRLTLRARLALLPGLAALAVVLSVAFSASMLHDRLLEDRVDKLRAVVQSAMTIAQGLQARVAAGALTREQAIEQLRQTLHLLRFDGGDGYVLVAALAAIQGISQTVRRVEEIATAISVTVDQQSAAIGEVSGNIHQAAGRTQKVAQDRTARRPPRCKLPPMYWAVRRACCGRRSMGFWARSGRRNGGCRSLQA